MPKPSQIPEWATNTNFDSAGQPWDGTPTKVEPTSGRKANGHEPRSRPSAQMLNWWRNLVGQWFEYVDEGLFSHTDKVRHIAAASYQAITNWALAMSSNLVRYDSSGAGDAIVPLDFNLGDRFKSFTLARFGDASADLIVTLWRHTAAGAAILLRQVTVTNPAAAWADTTVAPAASGTITGTISTASTGSITRSAGDFGADGFLAGQEIQLAGFSNAGNNVTRIVNTVTPLSIGFTSNAGLVNEAGTGDESVTQVFPTVGAGESYHLRLNASATALSVGRTEVIYDRPVP